MLLKGIISKLNTASNTAEIILPEYDDAVTAELPFYNRTIEYENINVGDFVIVAIFNNDNDFNNGVIL